MSEPMLSSEDLNSLPEKHSVNIDQPDDPLGSTVNIMLTGLATTPGARFQIADLDLNPGDGDADTANVENSKPALFGGTTTHPFVTMLVGRSELLREGLSRILDATKFRIFLSAACVDDLLKKPALQHQSILLIMDVGGIDTDVEFAKIADFKAIYPTSHVVVLADHCRSSDIVSAFRAGTDAYLTKVATHDTFIKALELVMLGQTVLPSQTSKFVQDIRHGLKEQGLSILSTREKCILRCLIDGESNKTIAREINIAEATVKVHVKAILRKIRVRNRTQAAVWAMNHGVLTPASGDGPSGNEKVATQPSRRA